MIWAEYCISAPCSLCTHTVYTMYCRCKMRCAHTVTAHPRLVLKAAEYVNICSQSWMSEGEEQQLQGKRRMEKKKRSRHWRGQGAQEVERFPEVGQSERLLFIFLFSSFSARPRPRHTDHETFTCK